VKKKKKRPPAPPKADAFDARKLRPLLLEAHGDVGLVAYEIGADSERLRDFVMNTPALRRTLEEVVARGVDKSVGVLFQSLADLSPGVRMTAAKEFLRSRAGQRRGFHHNKELEVRIPRTGALTLTWLPPEDVKPLPPMIEGKVEK
jgi:hypothetical protein